MPKYDTEKTAPVLTMSDKQRDFLQRIKELQPGQSFLVDSLDSNDRKALTSAQVLINKTYITRRDDNKIRVWCVGET